MSKHCGRFGVRALSSKSRFRSRAKRAEAVKTLFSVFFFAFRFGGVLLKQTCIVGALLAAPHLPLAPLCLAYTRPGTWKNALQQQKCARKAMCAVSIACITRGGRISEKRCGKHDVAVPHKLQAKVQTTHVYAHFYLLSLLLGISLQTTHQPHVKMRGLMLATVCSTLECILTRKNTCVMKNLKANNICTASRTHMPSCVCVRDCACWGERRGGGG